VNTRIWVAALLALTLCGFAPVRADLDQCISKSIETMRKFPQKLRDSLTNDDIATFYITCIGGSGLPLYLRR
jgi:hypothetical protein